MLIYFLSILYIWNGWLVFWGMQMPAEVMMTVLVEAAVKSALLPFDAMERVNVRRFGLVVS